jgi:hypothetical protein
MNLRLSLERDTSPEIAVSDWEQGLEITGSVVDESGVPIPATISIVSPTPEDATGEENDLCDLALLEAGLSTSTTDSSGAFRLSAIPCCSPTITVTSPGHETKTMKLVATFKQSKINVGEISLREIAELFLSFDLSDVDADYPFKIEILSENRTPHLLQREDWVGRATAEIEDESPLRFVFDPGLYTSVFSKGGTDIFAMEQFLLTPGLHEITLRPRPIEVYGEVRDDDGSIPDAELTFSCAGNLTHASSSGEGSFETKIWTAAPCGVSVETSDGRQYLTNLDLEKADFGDRVELPLFIPSNIISGVVVDADSGNPVVRAEVALKEVFLHREGSGLRRTVSDEEGRFTFKGARGEESTMTIVHVSAENYLPEQKDVFFSDNALAAEIRIELRKATGLSGQVVDPGGRPIAGAYVGCCGSNPSDRQPISDTTNAKGEFYLESYPGATVFAVSTGYAIGWGQQQEDGTAIRLMPRVNLVEVRLLDADRQPVERARISFSTPGVGIIPWGVLDTDAVLNGQTFSTDSNGRLATASLPPGLYRAWLLTLGPPIAVGTVPVPAYGEVALSVPHP